MAVKVNIRESGEIQILDIEGRVDDYGRSLIEEAFNGLLNNGKSKIICNMQSVEYIGPGALRTFLDAMKTAREEEGDVKLCSLQPSVQRIFEFAGVRDDSPFYKDVKQALSGFKSLRSAKTKAPADGISEADLYNQTIQMGSSPLEKRKKAAVREEQLYERTIQMGDSPLKKQPVRESHERTIQMGDSPLKRQPAGEQLYEKTIQREDSPLNQMDGGMDLFGQTIAGNAPPSGVIPSRATSQHVPGKAQDVAISEDRLADNDLTADDDSPLQSIFEDESEPTSLFDSAAEQNLQEEIAYTISTPQPEQRKSEQPGKAEEAQKVFTYDITYKIRGKIAEGNIGKLYYGEECSACGFSKPVALKYIKTQYSTKDHNMALIARELRKASLITHQNIAQVHKLVALDDYFFIVMEYVDGVNVATFMKKVRNNQHICPPHLASLIVFNICRALGYANKKLDDEGTIIEMIHGEITPENVIISRDFDIKLVGLGISKVSSMIRIQEDEALFHRVAYTAPEVRESGTPSKTGDIFSIGVLFYELLTNKKPFAPNQIGPHLPPPVPPSQINEKTSDILDGVVLRCLSSDPQRRFKDFQDIALHLEESLRDKGFGLTQASFEKFLELNKVF